MLCVCLRNTPNSATLMKAHRGIARRIADIERCNYPMAGAGYPTGTFLCPWSVSKPNIKEQKGAKPVLFVLHFDDNGVCQAPWRASKLLLDVRS